MELSERVRPKVGPPQVHSDALQTHELLTQLGTEVARELSLALERVTALAGTGRINRSSLSALCTEVGRAHRAGIMGQQVGRLASGRIKPVSERVDLTGLLQEALRQRHQDIEARGLELRRLLAQAEVMADATLSFALLQSLLDWVLDHAASHIDLKLDVKPWPKHARLTCAFSYRPGDDKQTGESKIIDGNYRPLDTMSWCLLKQTATVMGLVITRLDTHDRTTLTLEFPETVHAITVGLPFGELGDSGQQKHSVQSLTGRHVLVVANRREVRSLVRDALRPMGLMIDFVNSVEEAMAFCRDGLPHALVYEAALAGERFERLRAQILNQTSLMAFVQIAEHGRGFEALNIGTHQYARVGIESLLESLPPAMLFELARSDNNNSVGQ